MDNPYINTPGHRLSLYSMSRPRHRIQEIETMFTRKDYKVIAKIIKGQKEFADVFVAKQLVIQRISDIADGLADYFAEDNPRFNREKFLVACGLME